MRGTVALLLLAVATTAINVTENTFFLPHSLVSVQRGWRKTAGSLLAAGDFLPCVTVGVIAMSQLEDFVWADVVVFLQKEGASQNTN